jgi:ribosomal-protein-alanine N-acetyltransferase
VDWKLVAGQRIGHFITIDVDPKRRRSGLGSTLMRAGEQYLGSLGCLAITLEVATDNTAAQRFYEQHGYAETGRIPAYYPNNTDALVMRKSLQTDDLSG